MVFYLIIIFVVIIAAAIGVSAWFILRTRRLSQPKPTTEETQATPTTKETKKPEKLPFRWSYIMVPLIVLSQTIALSAYFYPKLPAEVAIQLKFGGAPDRFLSRGMTMALAIAPQVCLTALGAGITWIIIKLRVLSRQTWDSSIKPERILWLMGNLLAVPQGMLCFTMFNIFLYNAYQTQMLPTWLFLLIALGVGGALLGIFLVFILFRLRERPASQP